MSLTLVHSVMHEAAGYWKNIHVLKHTSKPVEDQEEEKRGEAQLRANIREMEKLCARVCAKDGPALQALVTPIRERALAAAQDFLLLHSDPAPCPLRADQTSAGTGAPLGCPSAGRSGDREAEEPDLKDLSGMVTEFSLLVHSVGYKLAMLPVAGALLGGVLGGPLGLLAGFKVAAVAAALGGGALGYAGGNLVQKQRRATVELHMKELTASPPPGQENK
ncbi:hypothetical protein CRUP_034947 [Coryphaenoides rupestris]|nr:hypothetical protein CRUP_034947 [Coryphaenoides rupestris]